ncbi:porin family protein [Polaribacter sargassicola]|uniref:porin family protein n=1 Tax=Polaribacter sargassicola TaxID=2836891 RepID=UPI001F2540D0|nr:porin family protein [Polaribacter sp. DS7-9]MCG1035389.1 outer membrane beta-barrel protein [Polaribacter sp. DS7-9]
MRRFFVFFIFLFVVKLCFAQKDSLEIGSRYADDQVYLSISYSQLIDQPSAISKSNFSYGLSFGFIKDVILNKQGNVSVAAGFGYGYNFFNHQLKVERINDIDIFSDDSSISKNFFKSSNLEFPIELRWRTSSINKYDFWRIYAGIKFLYNFSNKFEFVDEDDVSFEYSNINSYNKLQYGLTISAGYDEFNINVYYGLTPVFDNSYIEGEKINTKILKFGLIFYLL